MIAFIDINGNISGIVYGVTQDDLQGITKLQNSTYAVFIDDTQYSDVEVNQGEYVIQNIIAEQPNQFGIPIATGNPVFTPIPDTTKLQNYQNAKINQLRQSLENGIATFQSSALGSEHTYLNDDSSRTLLASEYAFVRSSDYDNSNIQWYTKDQGRLSHAGTQIAQVFLDGRKWTANQYSHYDNLYKQVEAVTLTNQTLIQAEAQIDAIVWTPNTPTGLQVVTPTTPVTGQVQLQWNANTDANIAGYNVYQDNAKINSNVIVSTFDTITGLTSGTTHNFSITAIDTDGFESTQCTAISVTVA